MTVKLPFKVNEVIVHPVHGIVLVKEIKEQEILGERKKYYVLKPLFERLSEVMIPVDRIQILGVRKAINSEEIIKIFQTIQESPQDFGTVMTNWGAQYQKNLKMVQSGDIISVCRILKYLAERRKKRHLSKTDDDLYDKALNLVVSEISHVLNLDSIEIRIMLEFVLDSEPTA
ncbi:MAG: CarD family transcriptional regulator [Candidatus Wallbacteria bacterium]|nr:CarD family transcriptional regulator [Candidatus Wallbacteria bacterium]